MKIVKIVLIGIGILIVVLIVTAMIVFSIVNKANNKVYEPKEVVYKGHLDKKALILYQPSKGDTTENITKVVAKELNALGYIVVVNYPSENLTYNLNDYDVIAFGSPVYMGQTSKPLSQYIKDNKFTEKKVLIYLTGSSIEEMAELNKVEENLQKGNNVYKIKVSKDQEEKIKEFVTSSVSK